MQGKNQSFYILTRWFPLIIYCERLKRSWIMRGCMSGWIRAAAMTREDPEQPLLYESRWCLYSTCLVFHPYGNPIVRFRYSNSFSFGMELDTAGCHTLKP